MIQLKCENCGGVVERSETQVFASDSAVIILAGHGFECQYCGARFEPGTSHEHVTSNTVILNGDGAVAIGGSVAARAGGIAIAGNVGGDIITGNKAVMFDTRGTKKG